MIYERREPYEELREEVAEDRGMTVEQRARVLEALCAMAAEQIAQHPDPSRALQWQDPLSPETETLMRKLRAQWKRSG